MRKFLLLVALPFIFSCSSDSPEVPDTTSSEGSLIKSEKEYFFGALEKETTYYYNPDNTISKIEFNSVHEGVGNFEYFYDENGRMEYFTLSLVDPFGDEREEVSTLFYEGERIARVCTDISMTSQNDSFPVKPMVDKTEFEYNSQGLVTKIIRYSYGDQESSTCEELPYIDSTVDMEFDTKGNLSRMEDSGNFFGSNYLTYTHDDTFHPYRNLKPVYYRNIYNYSSENNVIAAEEFDADTNEKIGYVKYEYEFNENNYPIRLDKIWSTSDNSIYQSSAFEYTYY
ncbi:hypothetical protein GCM10023115_28510 [Pontixanthobacter gangjinensis]|uniref:YD repeat-containing protein n=1 Tax=Christiangramia aestuarii TaxID=1028746 RepID=A0A7K1LMX0_9FLAO|nr:hypothetical protein [Christiangramia aestuarii]MUP42083.1 hypothetical protein [Christiangramia aestuarii]